MTRKKDKMRRKTRIQAGLFNVPKVQPLPIEDVNKKKEILDAVKKNQVVIIIGNTGCGKSTQIPQMLYHANYAEKGIIACTQPRRIGAFSLAKRVAAEMGCEVGETVGYKIRFENVWGEDTKILYLTDGSLVRACPENLRLYSVVVLDEVHERSLQTDVLFGLLKKMLKERSDLRVILSSATINPQKMSDYFGKAPIVEVHGTMFKIDVSYEPQTKDYLSVVASKVKEIMRKSEEGDILAFLPGKFEIEQVHRLLHYEQKQNKLFIVHAHAELSSRDLKRIHEPAPDGIRKVILSTNMAETSLTIEGVVFVVDSGRVKRINHYGRTGINHLGNVWCSRAEADQRKGRAGRTQNGHCHRLYTEDVFKNMNDAPIPEVKRLDLSSLVLQLKAIGYHNVRSFDFIDPPNATNLKAAHDQLHRLGALNNACRLTKRGDKMSHLPLEPKFAAALLHAVNLGCAEEVLRICAIMSAVTGTNIKKLSPQLRRRNFSKFGGPVISGLGDFVNADSDLVGLLCTFDQYIELLPMDFSRHEWCYNEELNDNKLREAVWTYCDLRRTLERLRIPLPKFRPNKDIDGENIAKAFLEGGFFNLAVTEGKKGELVRDSGPALVENVFLQLDCPGLDLDMGVGVNPEIVFGLDLMLRGQSKDRILTCVTRVPDDVNFNSYEKRLKVCCPHVEWPSEEEEPVMVEELKMPTATKKKKKKKQKASTKKVNEVVVQPKK